MFNSGFKESGYSEFDYNLEDTLGASKTLSEFPMSYNCMDYCDLKVEDQGKTMQCVAYSLAKILEYNYETINNTNEHYYVDKQKIYNSRSNKLNDEGMTFREALNYIKHNDYGIKCYGRLYSRSLIMKSIFVNGPCVMALPVKDSSRVDFWNGSGMEGGHAVCCVGYNEEGFIILNSWGITYGDCGTSILPYGQFNKVIECWAVIM